MNISANTKIMGLIGQNISHTLSPVIHNYSSSKLGIDCCYLPIDVTSEKLETVLDSLFSIGAHGFNVTVPHKIAAGKIFSGKEQSINTIYKNSSGKISVTSTDGEGFCNGLNQIHKSIDDFKDVIFIGNGGAVIAIVDYLYKANIKLDKITVLRRSSSKDELFDRFSDKLSFEYLPLDEKSFHKTIKASTKNTLLVQGTSAPLYGDDLGFLCNDLEQFKGSFVDLIYGNKISKLYTSFKALGTPSIDGLAMLIEQARLSQLLWWGQNVSYENIQKKLLEYSAS